MKQLKVIQLFDKTNQRARKNYKKTFGKVMKSLTKKVANICQIKGIGILTIATILAETNGF
ncbi:hypothetical protein [Flavobacterium sp.]|uniref:hypothetical protein n=1 Tax=Flavobacterium sp. TaxID=239 RepID=UPI003526C65C